MKLYDEKLALLDPIDKFVPETKGSDKAKIPLRSLLFHESGITSFIPYYNSAIDPTVTKEHSLETISIYHAQYAGAWGRTDYLFLNTDLTRFLRSVYMPVAKNLYASKQMHDVLLRDVIAAPLQKIKDTSIVVSTLCY